jgi:hypothetical protein
MERGGRETSSRWFGGAGLELDAVEVALEDDESRRDDDRHGDDGNDDAGPDHGADLRAADPTGSGLCPRDNGV